MTLRQKILLLGFSALVALCFALWRQYDAYLDQYRLIEAISHNTRSIDAHSRVVHELQKERGLTTIVLSGGDRGEVLHQRTLTDDAVARLVAAGGGARLAAEVAGIRQSVDAGSFRPLAARDRFTRVIRRLTDEMDGLTRRPDGAPREDDVAAHARLVAAKEYLGQLRATVGYGIEDRGRDAQARLSVVRLKSLFDEELRKFRLEASDASRQRFEARFASPEVATTLAAVNRFAEDGALPPGMASGRWWATATVAVDRIKEVEDWVLARVVERSGHDLASLNRLMLLGIAATLLVGLLVAALTISSIVSLLRALDRMLTSIEGIASSQDFANRIPVESGDEIGRISRSFNQLLEVADRLLTEKDYFASHDALTGIHNRRSFTERLTDEVAHKRRHPGAMALILFDIDHFKRVNDHYGHDVGDEVLKAVARLVAGSIRTVDFFSRWGGEEFVLLLRDDDRHAAEGLAEKLRALLAGYDHPQVGTVTGSFGVSEWRQGDSAEQFVKRADEALYAAKRGGRNRVCCDEAESLPELAAVTT